MKQIQVREIAFARSGDKGDVSNVHVHLYDDEHYELLKEALTVEKIADEYDELVEGDIEIYELEGTRSLNIVMDEALDGGVVGRTLNLDIHGKSRGNILMDMKIEVSDDFTPPKKPHRGS